MEDFWKTIIGKQFGAAIDMLENAIRACPDEVWCDPTRRPEWVANDIVGPWYLAYHTLFYLDFYLSDSIDDFGPPAPFNRDEFDSAGLLPEQPYSRDLLLTYLDHCRRKCDALIQSLTGEKARQPSPLRPEQNLTVAERLLGTMRHVQHHAAQLNLILRQKTNSAPSWVSVGRRAV